MSTIPDWHIRTMVRDADDFVIEPFKDENLQPASYDLTLDDKFRKMSRTGGPTRLIDPKDPQDRTFPVEGVERIGMEPNTFLLASTVERVQIPANFIGRVEGKSSLARLGLIVHVTAGFIDPGFNGHITLELACVNGRGIYLYPGMLIAQIAFEQMASDAEMPYTGKYQDAPPGPQASRYWKNFL